MLAAQGGIPLACCSNVTEYPPFHHPLRPSISSSSSSSGDAGQRPRPTNPTGAPTINEQKENAAEQPQHQQPRPAKQSEPGAPNPKDAAAAATAGNAGAEPPALAALAAGRGTAPLPDGSFMLLGSSGDLAAVAGGMGLGTGSLGFGGVSLFSDQQLQLQLQGDATLAAGGRDSGPPSPGMEEGTCVCVSGGCDSQEEVR